MDYKRALTELLQYDIGRNAYFDVQLFPPKGVALTTEPLQYLCHTAELPGESTATISRKIYGVVEKFPIMTGYNDITLSFYVRGSEFDVVRYNILKWLTYATGRGSALNSGETTYNVAYKQDIVSDIVITHYSVSGKKLTSCKLINAFPLAISETPLNWSMANQAMALNVTFAYTEYTYNMTPRLEKFVPTTITPIVVTNNINFTVQSPTLPKTIIE